MLRMISSAPWYVSNESLHNDFEIPYVTEVIRINTKGKGKAVPLQAWSGPEGSRKLRFPDYVTM